MPSSPTGVARGACASGRAKTRTGELPSVAPKRTDGIRHNPWRARAFVLLRALMVRIFLTVRPTHPRPRVVKAPLRSLLIEPCIRNRSHRDTESLVQDDKSTWPQSRLMARWPSPCRLDSPGQPHPPPRKPTLCCRPCNRNCSALRPVWASSTLLPTTSAIRYMTRASPVAVGTQGGLINFTQDRRPCGRRHHAHRFPGTRQQRTNRAAPPPSVPGSLVLDDDRDALAHELWRLTYEEYRKASKSYLNVKTGKTGSRRRRRHFAGLL